MRTALCSLIILVSSLASASAQSFSSDDMAEVAALITEQTDDRWRVSFAVADRTLRVESRAMIDGKDVGRGTPAPVPVEQSLAICLRLTAKPSAQSRREYAELWKQKESLSKTISPKVRVALGYQKGSDPKLTKAEWRQYFDFCKLERQLDELEPPTLVFRSIYFVDTTPDNIVFNRNASPTARQLLSDRGAILGLFNALDP